MASAFDNAGIFLISTLFDLYLFVLALRIVLVWVRADYYNPLSQFVIKLSQFLIVPLRRVIPNVANLELATLVVMILIAMVKFYLLCWLTQGLPNPAGIFVLAMADSLKLFVNIFFYAILLQVILSWVQRGYSPLNKVIHQITFPIIRPFQRLIPPIGGMDISPIPALLVLQLILILVVAPLSTLGANLAL